MLEHCETARIKESTSAKDPLVFLDDVVRYAFARLGSKEEAEDVAMEVFHAAFQIRSELFDKQDPGIYLIGMARRKVGKYLRDRNRQRGSRTLSLNDPGFGEIPSPFSDGISDIITALDSIVDIQREVLVLKYVMGFSVVEIGRLIHKSPQATNSLLQRGRESLRIAAPHLITEKGGSE